MQTAEKEPQRTISTLRTHFSESEWRPQKETTFGPLSSREILEGFSATSSRFGFSEKPAWNMHSNCVSKLEHEIELQSLKSQHARELEEQKRVIVSSFEDRMKEFEDSCISQYQEKVKSLEASHVSNADVLQLEAKLDACSLSEEIIKRKCEGKLARAEIVIQEFRLKLEREQLRASELMLELERKTKDLAEARSRTVPSAGNDKDTAASSLVRLESDYKRVAKDLSEEKRRYKPSDAKLHVRELQRDNEQLMTERHALQLALHEAEATINSLKSGAKPSPQKHVLPQADSAQPSTGHIHELRCFYEKTIMSLSDELLQWKEKSMTLATKIYASLKEIKAQVRTLKADAVDTKEKMLTELRSAVESPKAGVKTPRRSGSTTAVCGKTWCSAKSREETGGKKKQ